MTRARSVALAIAAAGSLAIAGEARAQTFGSDSVSEVESPQNFAFELRVGEFLPRIDSEFTPHNVGGCSNLQSPGPFWDTFSTRNALPAGQSPTACDARGLPIYPMLGAEFDWQIVRLGPVGSLGVGVSAMFAWASTQAPTQLSMMQANTSVSGCSASTLDNPNCWTLSTENTTLDTVPLTAVAVLRLDGLARRFTWFPIVPYVKAGLAYTFWWVYKGPNVPQAPNGQPEAGGSMGWHAAIGIQLMLDAFSPREARQLDANWGVNHSYVFLEGLWAEMLPSSLGGNPQLNVGMLTWTAGVALEF